jgi:AraC-like DNA-binding protein
MCYNSYIKKKEFEMEYRLVKLHSIPMIYFAHSFEVSEYYYQRLQSFNHFEISYVEKGELTRTDENNLYNIPEHTVEITIPGESFVQNCNNTHIHHTVGFLCTNETKSITTQEIISRQRSINSFNEIEVIFPNIVPPNEDAIRIRCLLKKLIQTYHVSDSVNRQLACMDILFSILYLLTDISYKEALNAEKHNPSHLLYIQKAKQYIAEHIDDRIIGNKVASELGITHGYLCSVFKDVTGQTLFYYINQMKLNKVLELLTVHDITLSQAGEMVGFTDPHYLSRLFKKHYGVSYRDYISKN